MCLARNAIPAETGLLMWETAKGTLVIDIYLQEGNHEREKDKAPRMAWCCDNRNITSCTVVIRIDGDRHIPYGY